MRLPFPMKYSQQVFCMRSKQGGRRDVKFSSTHWFLFHVKWGFIVQMSIQPDSLTSQVYHRHTVQTYVLSSHNFGFWLWMCGYLFYTVLCKSQNVKNFFQRNITIFLLKSCFKNLILGWTKSTFLFICFRDLSTPVKTQRRMLIQFLMQMPENLIFKLSKQKSNILISSERSSMCFFWHIKIYVKEAGKI